MKPLISVIVPVYKVEAYLHKCVDSILAQTYENIEIILVNDGSPDNCGAVCDEYAANHNHVRVIHKENGGLSSARNAGVDIAGGRYIGFVDSDDYISPDMYEKLFNAIADADLAICNCIWVDESGTPCEEVPQIKKEATLTREQALEILMESRNNVAYVTAWNRLYKSELLKAVRFPVGKIHEDEFTVHHFFNECKKIAVITDGLYFYVQREGSITGLTGTQFTVKGLDGIDALRDRYKFFKSLGHKKYSRRLFRRVFRRSRLYVFKLKGAGRGRAFRQFLNDFFTLLITPNLWLVPALMFRNFLVKRAEPLSERIRRARLLRGIKSKVNSIRKREKSVIFLLSTPTHGNLGDHAIAYAEIRFLKKVGLGERFMELNADFYTLETEWLQRDVIRPEDIILIHGGGFLGTLWEEEDDRATDIISRFKMNKIFIFPQTCYYAGGVSARERLERNISVYKAAKDLTVCLRDRASYDFMNDNFPGVKTVFSPDIVLSVTDAPKTEIKSGVLLCFRSDREKAADSVVAKIVKEHLFSEKFIETDTVTDKIILEDERELELHEKWQEFSQAKLVITDRLHGMIFAAITHTPCIALDNVSRKVSGSYEWIRELPYICIGENADEVLAKIPEMLNADTSVGYVYPDILEREITDAIK